jgi:hypothetical protein
LSFHLLLVDGAELRYQSGDSRRGRGMALFCAGFILFEFLCSSYTTSTGPASRSVDIAAGNRTGSMDARPGDSGYCDRAAAAEPGFFWSTGNSESARSGAGLYQRLDSFD